MRPPARLLLASILFVLTAAFMEPVNAQVPMTGRFIAEARCPAYQSIENATNPGGVTVAPGFGYDLVGRNAEDATHYHLLVPGADPPRRWVALGCGRVETSDETLAAEPQLRERMSRQARGRVGRDIDLASASFRAEEDRSGAGEYVLAVSWQPAFCELNRARSECRGPVRSRGESIRFSLHGLWPGDRGTAYCGKAAALADTPWQELPEPAMRPTTERLLADAMPGVASGLHRHQWTKHGSCYGEADADEYFSDSIMLLSQLNRSAVQAAFAGSAGQYLSERNIRTAFDRAFGAGAGERVVLRCENDGPTRLLTEMRIALAGAIEPQSRLRDLIQNAVPVDDRGCAGGTVQEP